MPSHLTWSGKVVPSLQELISQPISSMDCPTSEVQSSTPSHTPYASAVQNVEVLVVGANEVKPQ